MAHRKNVKRIDPRYFMDEKTDAPLNEVGDVPRFSPLSSTKPGERIPAPGSQRPLEDRGLGQGLEVLSDVISLVDETFQKVVDKKPRDENGDLFMAPEMWELGTAIKRLTTAHTRLDNLMGDDPNAPRLEE